MKLLPLLSLTACLGSFAVFAADDVEPLAQPALTETEAASDLGADVSLLKDELVDLRADLLELEQKLLTPPSSRLEVFFSMDLGQSILPDALTIYLDDQEIAHHLYTERQQAALVRGAVHPVFTGNISHGEHELRILLIGQNQQRELKRATSFSFEKSDQVVALEFSMRDLEQGGAFQVIDHSPENQ